MVTGTQAKIRAEQITGIKVKEEFTGYLPEGLGSLDDGPALQDTVNRMPSYGGQLILPNGLLKVESQVDFNKPVLLKGAGKAANYFDHYGTRLQVTNKTIDILKISSPACKFQDFDLYNSSTTAPTAGSGVLIDIQKPVSWYTGTPNLWPASFALESISVFGFFDCIHHTNGMESRMMNCDIYSPVRRGVHYECAIYPDAGDLSVMGCNFYPQKYDGAVGFYQISGGGVRFVSNKWNGRNNKYFTYCYQGAGLPSTTSILQFTGNSFENFTGSAIKITSTGFQMVEVVGPNEFAPYRETTGAFIEISGVAGITIGSNTIRKASSTKMAISLSNCSQIVLNPNNYVDYGGAIPVELNSCTQVRNYDAVNPSAAVATPASAQELTFPTVNKLALVGTNKWGPSGATVTGYGNTGLSDKKLPAGVSGRIWATFAPGTATVGQKSLIGFKTANTLGGFATLLAAVNGNENGSVAAYSNGTAVNSTIYTTTGATAIAIYRDGTTGQIKAQRSTDQVTWTDIYTFAATSTADLYIGADVYYNATIPANSGVLDQPRANNTII